MSYVAAAVFSKRNIHAPGVLTTVSFSVRVMATCGVFPVEDGNVS